MQKLPDFAKISRTLFDSLAPEVALKAKNFFLAAFIKEGFTDSSFVPWVKRRDNFTHKLLSRSYALKNSIKITSQTSNRIEIEAGRGIPYAEIHNKGGVIKVPVSEKMKRFFWYMYKKTDNEKYKFMALTKKQTITIDIPKRQYIGDSETLNKQIETLAIKTMVSKLKEYEANLS